MGKVKKASGASKDEGQKKISSFFQKPTDRQLASSKLFSEIGTDRTGKDTAKPSVGTKVSPIASSKSKENKSPSSIVTVINDDAESDEFVPVAKKLRSPVFNSKTNKEKVGKSASKVSPSHAKQQLAVLNGNHSDISEPAVVPETQFFFTPENKQKEDEKKGHEVKKEISYMFQSPNAGSCCSSDFGIIPDTPKTNEMPVKLKRPLSRSFLLSSASMASNPIQKAKENREAKLALKKRAALARKSSSMAVSVEFKDENFVSREAGTFIQSGAANMISKGGPEAGYNVHNFEDNSKEENSVDDKTPTKVYVNSEASSVKRMAKPGISPVAKRTDDQMSLVDNTNEDTARVLSFDAKTDSSGDKEKLNIHSKIDNSISDEIESLNAFKSDQIEPFGAVIEFEKHKQEIDRKKKERLEQRKIELLKEKRKKDKEMKKKNNEKLLIYQLSGNVSSSGGNTIKTCKETVENDDTLEDLLQELKSPSLLKIDSVSKKTSTYSKSVKKSSNVDFFGKLPDTCDKETSCDKLAVLKSKPSVISQRVSLESDDSFGCMVSEWTDEDENFFKKLGMSTEAVAGEKTDIVCNRNVSIFTNQDLTDNGIKSSAINSVNGSSLLRTVPRLKAQFKASNVSGNAANFNPEVNVNADNEADIKDFQTQVSSTTDRVDNDIAVFPTPSDQEHNKFSKVELLEGMEIDEFGTQLDSQVLCDDFEHLTPFKDKKSSSEIFQTEAPCTEFGRHVVTAVEHDSINHETSLTLSSQPGDILRTCVLHGFWLDTHILAGDVVNVLAKFNNNVCHITDTEGLLIVNPDILLSGTTVVSSVFCMRKSILKEKFKGCDSGNIQMLYGSIIHSVFQQVLRKKLLTEEAILEEAERTVRQTSNLVEMYGNKITEDLVMEEIKKYLPQTIAWTKQHTNIGQDIFGNQRKTKPDILVTRVCDIEENIWSPRFGIKGKIDLTVEAQLKNEKHKKTVPLELKTGKPSYSVEHKGQVTLYSMMCSDRREDPRQGLLLYLKEPSMKIIPADHVNQKGLIQLRNEMAYYISRQVVKTTDQDQQTTFNLGRLPEPITNLRACQKCPQLINCAIYQREVENRQSRSDEMSGLVDGTLQHLTSSHMTYFTHWCLMLDLESQKDQAKKTVADIWCKSSTDRESVGECMSGVILSGGGDGGDTDDSVVLTFCRHKDCNISTPLSSIGINAQESVVISCEKPSWIAVCTGFVQKISLTDIQILIDREGADRLSQLKAKVLRIDKCDNFSTAGIYYTNVSRLMLDDSHCQKLRDLIIDRAKPEFLNTLSKGNIEKVKSIFKSLNKPQKTSVLKVLMSKDYVLVKGYPGTGKTSTIVALVKVLSILGYSVLLTSYTHSAVDNILLKLKKDSVKFLRLGRLSKIHPDIREFSFDKMTNSIKTTVQLEEFLHSQNIVATSCLGTNHPLFTRRQFDVCIVDEASQVVQPACLGPLFCCKKFVLVGDPKQLPPVVQSKEARELGMDESLFMRLENTGGTFDLNLQYRMNRIVVMAYVAELSPMNHLVSLTLVSRARFMEMEFDWSKRDIMYLSNQLVYEGCLKCGSDTVANQTLCVPNKNRITKILADHQWLTEVVDNTLQKSVVFLNTEKVPAPEEKSQAGTLQNPTEAKIVLKIVHTLVTAGVDPDEIGIIAPYRSQVFLIRQRISECEGHWRSKVEVNTVDQYQGRDKSVIVISFVRSSEDQENLTGELLKDVRRLNVALTRAKVKLILIGNVSTLIRYQPLKQLIQILKERNQISLVNL